MEIERIRKIAIKKGLMKDSKIFEKFITQRFPEEESESYIGEWAERFLGGNPTSYMDKKSMGVYIKILQEEFREVKNDSNKL